MHTDQGMTNRKIYFMPGLIFLLTAWFSVGYNHLDEHFQVIEFAGLKLGFTEAGNHPWEYDCMMRPALQSQVVFSIYKAVAVTGITDPFAIAFVIRLLSAMLIFLSIHMVIRLFAPEFTNRSLLYGFLLLSFFLWFVPYNCVRFSSETLAGRVFLIGLAWFFLQNSLLDKAAGFGVSPWWYCNEQTLVNAFHPLSLVYILAIFLYFWYFPKDIITWTIVPFHLVHFMIPRKEIRFLFPVIGFMPVMIVRVADIILKKRGYDLLERRTGRIAVRVFWYLNFIMLAVLIFRPAVKMVYASYPMWVKHFNFNQWMERTSFWYVYELKPVTVQP